MYFVINSVEKYASIISNKTKVNYYYHCNSATLEASQKFITESIQWLVKPILNSLAFFPPTPHHLSFHKKSRVYVYIANWKLCTISEIALGDHYLLFQNCHFK